MLVVQQHAPTAPKVDVDDAPTGAQSDGVGVATQRL